MNLELPFFCAGCLAFTARAWPPDPNIALSLVVWQSTASLDNTESIKLFLFSQPIDCQSETPAPQWKYLTPVMWLSRRLTYSHQPTCKDHNTSCRLSCSWLEERSLALTQGLGGQVLKAEVLVYCQPKEYLKKVMNMQQSCKSRANFAIPSSKATVGGSVRAWFPSCDLPDCSAHWTLLKPQARHLKDADDVQFF